MTAVDELTPVDVAKPKPPVSVPAVTRLAIVLALALAVAGGLLVRDALVAADLITGAPWITPVLDGVDGLKPQTWMIPAGIALAVLGVIWVLLSLSPRRRTELTLDPAGVAFVRPVDVARIARSTAGDIDGVLTAKATATRRKVRVRVTALGDPAQVRSAVEAAVTASVEPVHPTPSLSVSVRSAGGAS